LELFDREIMKGTDYRQKYITCGDYKESDHLTSEVDLLTALTQVSVKILTYVKKKLHGFSPRANYTPLNISFQISSKLKTN
jgi:hypothetical protein